MIMEQHAGWSFTTSGFEWRENCSSAKAPSNTSDDPTGFRANDQAYDDIDATQSPLTADIAEVRSECKIYTDVT